MNDESKAAVEIPFEQLSADALRGVVEAFVLREGTEYGERDVTLDQKLERVIEQLRRGEATILFDPGSAAVGIVMKRELKIP